MILFDDIGQLKQENEVLSIMFNQFISLIQLTRKIFADLKYQIYQKNPNPNISDQSAENYRIFPSFFRT